MQAVVVDSTSNSDHSFVVDKRAESVKYSFFCIRLCRLFCASLSHRASAFCNSLGVRGPFCRCPPLPLDRANLWISAVTLISLLQLENLWGLIASPFLGVVTVPTIFSWRFSISSSFGVTGAVSQGHSDSGSRRNSGPLDYLLFKSCTGIPLEMSSATLNSPGMCCHCIGLELLCISQTLEETSGLKLPDVLRVHANTIVLSVKNMTSLNLILDSS